MFSVTFDWYVGLKFATKIEAAGSSQNLCSKLISTICTVN